MEFEKKHNVSININPRFTKVSTLGEFVQIIYDSMHSEKAYTKATKDSIFEMVQAHLYEKHPSIPDVKPESNWYTDLGLTSLDRTELYVWIEDRFNIRLPFFYFKDVDVLCDKIYQKLPAKYKQQEPSLLDKAKQKIADFKQKAFQRSK